MNITEALCSLLAREPTRMMVPDIVVISSDSLTFSESSSLAYTYDASGVPRAIPDYDSTTCNYDDIAIPFWLSRDPIRANGAAHLYAFVGNRAFNAVDFLGLKTVSCTGGCHGAPPPDPSDGFSYIDGVRTYFGGDGSDVHIPFETVDPGWGLADFGVFPCDDHGSFINSPRLLDLYTVARFHSTAGPGRITIRVVGNVSWNGPAWSFFGTVSADSELFNFDPDDDWTHRGFWRELITRIVANIPAGRNFQMEFDGARPISAQGCCD